MHSVSQRYERYGFEGHPNRPENQALRGLWSDRGERHTEPGSSQQADRTVGYGFTATPFGLISKWTWGEVYLAFPEFPR